MGVTPKVTIITKQLLLYAPSVHQFTQQLKLQFNDPHQRAYATIGNSPPNIIVSLQWSRTVLEAPDKLGVSKSIECNTFSFTALMLWVRQQEGHLACKSWVLVCWWYPGCPGKWPLTLHLIFHYPRRARSASAWILFSLWMYVCMYVTALERKRLIGMT